jgi:hypothetical protein
MVKATIKDLRIKQPKIGDRVEFTIDMETLTDEVVYVNGDIIEGKKWDLSNITLTIQK